MDTGKAAALAFLHHDANRLGITFKVALHLLKQLEAGLKRLERHRRVGRLLGQAVAALNTRLRAQAVAL